MIAGKTALVTGATSGIGKETAVGLARLGARVVIVGRDRARTEAALADVRKRSGRADVEALLCDFASLDSIRALAAEVKQKYPQLSVLVNNAGAVNSTRQQTKDGFELTFGVNHLGYFLLTGLLVEVLKANAPARIVNVASNAHKRGRIDFDDPMRERGYSSWGAYSQSKLANVMHTYALARRLEGTGVTANCLHPGVVASNFGGGSGVIGALWKVGKLFMIDSEEGAKTSIWAASAPELERVSGKYFDKCAEARSTAASHDVEAQERLWAMSEKLTSPKR